MSNSAHNDSWLSDFESRASRKMAKLHHGQGDERRAPRHQRGGTPPKCELVRPVIACPARRCHSQRVAPWLSSIRPLIRLERLANRRTS